MVQVLVVVALGTLVTVVQVGHAGSRATWHDQEYCQGQAPAGDPAPATTCRRGGQDES